MSSVFGVDITSEDILENLSFFDSWEERYKYIIDLGKELPAIDESLKVDANIVRGCQSQVWLVPTVEGDQYFFQVDSDAHIVRGLLAIILSAFNGKTAKAILDFDVDAYFESIDLIRHLSPTRGNGLRAMVSRIKDAAQA
ncbi:SufE family protein [Reinekea marinisedimentorum]|uniref:Cysteine desulfuration protein SufE n=1 Tax=Reinekea marinisedimentorum TaxID=230495 RepID=A0A4R3I9H8_9GAMM|nr:SufE family protein [Reinekea marinisedimentorum]TCS42013.1 cysteine desulfuration protein SufE [Reinekea marinisedimentorum]